VTLNKSDASESITGPHSHIMHILVCIIKIMHILVCIIKIMHTFQRPTAVSGK